MQNLLQIDIESVLAPLEPITLAQMESIRLMNRIDSKFVCGIQMVPEILRLAQEDYFVQEIDAKVRLCRYHTIYYDTPTLEMYLMHHNRRIPRQKIRAREYCDTDDCFIEVKNKNNHGRTKKKRIEIPMDNLMNVLSYPAAYEFLSTKSKFPLEGLSPALSTDFSRITLVNKAHTERVTIDMSLDFGNMRNGVNTSVPNLVILELKRDGLRLSQMLTILNTLRIKSRRISKYCIGTALTDENVKQNRFKQKIRYIQKLSPLNYDTK